MTLLYFAIGLLSGVEVNLLGKLFVAEIVFLLITISLLIHLAERKLVFSGVLAPVVFIIISLLGYVVSDLFRGSPTENMLKGWGGLLVTLSNWVALFLILRKKPAKLYVVLLGYCAALLYFMDQFGGYALNNWKFGWALPSAIFAVILIVNSSDKKRIAVLFLLGIVNFMMDYRSLGLLLLVTAALLMTKRKLVKTSGNFFKASAYALSLLLLLVPFVSYIYTTSENINTDYSARRDASNAGRYATIAITIEEIIKSPLIGSGSWATTPELDMASVYAASEISGATISDDSLLNSFFRPHSQILQAWYEGGVLGVVFFIYLVLANIKYLKRYISRNEITRVNPFYVFWILFTLWNLFASPFGGAFRFYIALDLLVLHFISVELHSSIKQRRSGSAAKISV